MIPTYLICESIQERFLTEHDLRRFAVKCDKKYRLFFTGLRDDVLWQGKTNVSIYYC